MKKYLISVLLILISFPIYDAVPVLADDPCEDAKKQVQVFVSSLNSKIKVGSGKGLFEVKPIQQEGMVTRWSVTYRLSGRDVFLQDVTHPYDELTLSANIFSGHSSLIFKYSFGAGGAIGCGYAVFPRKEQFTALEIPYPFIIEDFDRDSNVELLVLEPEQWSDCVPARAYIPYWPRIFRLEPQAGKLVDVSKQFPQVYIDSLNKHQADYKQLNEEKSLSPECSMHYSQFLERLKQSSIKTNVEWETLNKEVKDLYNAGQYDRAVDVAKRALELAEKNVGPDHPDVAESLSNLAAIYYLQKQYAQAEPLYKRALEIWEKSLGPDHPTVVTTRKNMAALYQATNRGQEVDKLGQQAARISDSYFPLKEGRTWKYQMTKPSMLGSGGTETLNVTNFAARDLKGKKVTPQKLDSIRQSTFSFIAEDESGIFLYASQSAGAVEPEVKAARSYYLKNPVQVGTTWEENTATAYLTRKVPLTIKFTIESKDETVTVPAGTFNSCVKVKGIGYAQVNMGYMGGVAKITVEHHSWYALGIGLVRSIKKELSNNMMLGSFGETLELQSFRK